MIGILDYGMGNVAAFLNCYKDIDVSAKLIQDTNGISDEISHFILPGVGHFDRAMLKFKNSGMLDRLSEYVLVKKRPLLGVCIGMQMLAAGSDEGSLGGLGWISGHVKALSSRTNSEPVPLPNMGWLSVHAVKKCDLFRGCEGDDHSYYFLHSYYVQPKTDNSIIATSRYGGSFTAAIQSNNVFGVQFHPEKSHNSGLKLLKNFSEL